VSCRSRPKNLAGDSRPRRWRSTTCVRRSRNATSGPARRLESSGLSATESRSSRVGSGRVCRTSVGRRRLRPALLTDAERRRPRRAAPVGRLRPCGWRSSTNVRASASPGDPSVGDEQDWRVPLPAGAEIGCVQHTLDDGSQLQDDGIADVSRFIGRTESHPGPGPRGCPSGTGLGGTGMKEHS